MLLSVVIPAHNEESSLPETLHTLYRTLSEAEISHEILVVDDHSKDNTAEVLRSLSNQIPTLRWAKNTTPNGFGYAVRYGLDHCKGACVAIFMADLSDSPEDLVRYYRLLQEGYDCAFGTRFSKGGSTKEYPFLKWWINRIVNHAVRLTFRYDYDDTTNAFKLYKREVIQGIGPLLSPHFNLTLEMPLKAIIRGYSFAVVGITWKNRTSGVSKLQLKEMGSRYFFIFLYCLIEKYFSKGDYKKRNSPKTV